MSEIDHARDSYIQAVAAYRSAQEQVRAIGARQTELAGRIRSLEQTFDQHRQSLDRTLASFGAGAATEEDVTEGRQRVTAVEGELKDARELLAVVKAHAPKINTEAQRRRVEAGEGRRKLAEALWTRVEKPLQADKKLRAALLEIFALGRASGANEYGTSGTSSWPDVVGAIFDEPTEAEFEAAYSQALKHFDVPEASTDAPAAA